MISKEELAAYLTRREATLYPRLLLNRFFQGYVTAINSTVKPFQVQVKRVGEGTSDGNWYRVATLGYTPQIGDLGELVWRDDKVAYFLFPLNSTALTSVYMPIGNPVVLSAPAGSMSFANIPQGFQHLEVWVEAMTTDASPCNLSARFNANAGANYFGGVASFVAVTSYAQNAATTSLAVGGLTPSASTNPAVTKLTIFDYAQASHRIAVSFLTHRVDSGTVFTTTVGGGVFTVLGAITDIQLLSAVGNFAAGAKFWLYGI